MVAFSLRPSLPQVTTEGGMATGVASQPPLLTYSQGM